MPLTRQRLSYQAVVCGWVVVICGRAQTPSLDAVLALFPREVVQERLRKAAPAPL